MIKLFASDLDGTLYNALHQTDRGILRRLRRVIGAGRHVALATGRWSSTGAELGFGDLPLEVVSANGAFVYGTGGELLRSVPIDPAVLEEMLRAFPTCCLVCVAPDGTFVRGTREQQEASYLAPHGILSRIIVHNARKRGNPSFCFDQSAFDVLGHAICKVNCRIFDPGLKAEFAALAKDPALQPLLLSRQTLARLRATPAKTANARKAALARAQMQLRRLDGLAAQGAPEADLADLRAEWQALIAELGAE